MGGSSVVMDTAPHYQRREPVRGYLQDTMTGTSRPEVEISSAVLAQGS